MLADALSRRRARREGLKGADMLIPVLILLVMAFLLVVLVGLSKWRYSRGAYFPGAEISFVTLILLVLFLIGKL